MALYGVTDADESKPKWAVRGSGVDPQNILQQQMDGFFVTIKMLPKHHIGMRF